LLPEQKPQNDFENELLERFRKSPNLVPSNEGVALINQNDINKLASEVLVEPIPPISSEKPIRSSATWKSPLEAASEADEILANQKTIPIFVSRMDSDGHYHYYEPRWAETSCLICHRVDSPDLEPGDLIGIVEVVIIDPPSEAVATEYWVWLLAASILTAALAMLAFYVIIRWIIIKPLRHLRKVSDAISRGDITQRADLHTGDEFETLALAFNRTIRHILNSQEKLRGINTELDHRVDQLARLNVQLYESNRTKSDFMATMSHELRTPLNSIIGFSEVLSSIDSLDDKQKRYVDNISKSGKMLLGMINDILDMAKIESGRIVVEPVTFNIALIAGVQCDMAKPLGDRKNIDIVCDIPDNLPPMYQDATRLQQILNNLLSNAIKFTPEGGRIKVQVRRVKPQDMESELASSQSKMGRFLTPGSLLQDNSVRTGFREHTLELKVIDTGVGISEEDQQIIFEKFRQGKNSMTEGDAMKREYSGSGLGLSIVKELCRLLDGGISVESRLGLGSTFTVLLPWTLEPKTRIESEIMSDLQEFAKQKPRTKTHEAIR
jgi:signal transduction histidine kinase